MSIYIVYHILRTANQELYIIFQIVLPTVFCIPSNSTIRPLWESCYITTALHNGYSETIYTKESKRFKYVPFWQRTAAENEHSRRLLSTHLTGFGRSFAEQLYLYISEIGVEGYSLKWSEHEQLLPETVNSFSGETQPETVTTLSVTP